MKKKIVVVGGVAGGASAAARLRRLDARAELLILERGEHVSYSNCSLPYHLSGIVADSRDLVMMAPEDFKRRFDIEVRTQNEVLSIDREGKAIRVRDLSSGREYTERYDTLILSPGAAPIRPRSIEGVDREHVFTLRNVTDIEALKAFLDRDRVRDVVVAGGGFVGVEAVENLRAAGKNVTLIESMDQILAPFDYDMAQTLHKELLDNGVSLLLSCTLTAIREDAVLAVKDGEELVVPAQAVLLAVGVRPETGLAAKAGLAIGETGGIRVNHNYQTSDPDIYAVGDAIEAYDRLARRPGRLALAGPAQRQARAAADHICGIPAANRGYIGSACVRLFGQNAACTGLSEKAAARAGIPCGYAYVLPPDKVGLMPDSHYMGFKLIYEEPTGRILGAQAVGRGSVDKRADVIAAMIAMGGTLEDLKELELCYAPVFGTAKDVVNMAALVGLNLLHGCYRQVPVTGVRALVEEGAYIVDVREEGEYKAGHLNGSHNIPLSRLRERMAEIPRDIPVYLHCRTGQRSYYAISLLQGSGYRNVWNISGSFLGISLYEYYNDRAGRRAPIVTAYNFR